MRQVRTRSAGQAGVLFWCFSVQLSSKGTYLFSFPRTVSVSLSGAFMPLIHARL